MTSLGFLSGELDRERRRLAELNSALIDVEADALGFASDFELGRPRVEASRDVLLSFVESLLREFESAAPHPDFREVVRILKTGSRANDDWVEDLRTARNELRGPGPLSITARGIVGAIIESLDLKFARDLRQISRRR